MCSLALVVTQGFATYILLAAYCFDSSTKKIEAVNSSETLDELLPDCTESQQKFY
jgi:hypothetical protein